MHRTTDILFSEVLCTKWIEANKLVQSSSENDTVMNADFPCQKGSLLMDTISCVSLFLERQTNVLFIGVFNALIHEQFLYRSQSITAKTGGCAG